MQSGVDLFAVANVREAAEIREMASGWPILVLGPLLEEEDSALLDYELIATLSSAGELTRFRQLAWERKRPIRVHLKLDTGMGRLGAWWEEANALIEETAATKEVELCGILTHFADPSDPDFTRLQRSRFCEIWAIPCSKSRRIFWCMPTIRLPSRTWKPIPSSMRFASDCFNLESPPSPTACSPGFPWNRSSPFMPNWL